MNSKHPAPWQALKHSGSASAWYVIDARNEPVVSLVEEEVARLIAEAPAMATLLREVAKHFAYVGEEDSGIAKDVTAMIARIDATCATCGATITDAQASLSQMRADNAPAECKDCCTAKLTREREAKEWRPTSVGCHWTRGESEMISTYSQGAESGYRLMRDRREVGRYPTLDAAKQAADEGGDK